MSYRDACLGINLINMPYLPVQYDLTTQESMGLRSLITQLVGRWILSVLLATWPAGASTPVPPCAIRRFPKVVR